MSPIVELRRRARASACVGSVGQQGVIIPDLRWLSSRYGATREAELNGCKSAVMERAAVIAASDQGAARDGEGRVVVWEDHIDQAATELGLLT